MTIDKKLEKYCGLIKCEETESCVTYIKVLYEFSNKQEVRIARKSSGRHLITSYDPDNKAVGLTWLEAKLLCKKLKEMRNRYNWS